jgi:hypothetical protein
MLIFLGLPFGVALGIGATVRHWRKSHLERRFSLIILGAGLLAWCWMPALLAGR